MITKSDWDAVHRQMLDEERKRLGDLPSTEEILAYTRGELSGDDEARVRETLVAYPDLARAAVQPFSLDGEKSADVLSEHELAQRWAMLQKRIHEVPERKEGRVLQFWRGFSAIAATLAIAFGALLWQARSDLREPRVAAEDQVLLPDGRRGGGDELPVLSAVGESYLLVASVVNQPYHGEYRIVISRIDGDEPRPLWRSGPLHRTQSDSFAVFVPRAFFARPGKYQLILYGAGGAGEEPLATYSLRVPRR